MMMMCKRLEQVPMLCVPIYNMKLAMMQKTPIFTTFSAHTKMAADKREQNEVFARIISLITPIFTTFSAHTKMAADKREQNEVFARIISHDIFHSYSHHWYCSWW